jgi:hypothetical protein
MQQDACGYQTPEISSNRSLFCVLSVSRQHSSYANVPSIPTSGERGERRITAKGGTDKGDEEGKNPKRQANHATSSVRIPAEDNAASILQSVFRTFDVFDPQITAFASFV